MTESYRYKAFISYSHRDKAAADKLLKDIENYRMPKRLVGKAALDGTIIPDQVGQIFRDRDELPAAEDLTAEVKKALTQSEFMIVLCSPVAAASRWVNREIIEFKKLTGERRILSVILSGEPFASNQDRPEEECFPPALRFKLGKGGALTTKPAEPLAADFRAMGDGPRRGKLKLIAGLLGIGLDALIERDLQRKMRRVMAVTAASVLAMVGMASLTYEAVTARQDAERHRGEAEGLIEFMLTDLRDKLEPVGRLDVLDVVGEKAVEYYDTQPLDEMPDDALGRRARAFHLLGEIQNLQGANDNAQNMFERASMATKNMLSRDPHNPQRIFEHSQSVFWVGYRYWQNADYSNAEVAFLDYKHLAEKLVEVDSNQTRAYLELSYANSTLGTLFLRQKRNLDAAIMAFDKARTARQLSYNLIVVQGINEAEKISLVDDLSDYDAWIADTYLILGDFQKAREFRSNEIVRYGSLLELDPYDLDALQENAPDNLEASIQLLNARLAASQIDFITGKHQAAQRDIRMVTDTMYSIVEQQLALCKTTYCISSEWLKYSALSYVAMADVNVSLGRLEEAITDLQKIKLLLQKMGNNYSNLAEVKTRISYPYEYFNAKIDYLKSNYANANLRLDALLSKLNENQLDLHTTKGGTYIWARSTMLEANLHSTANEIRASCAAWNNIIERLGASRQTLSPYNKHILANALIQTGKSGNDRDRASKIITELNIMGFSHPNPMFDPQDIITTCS
ncbi:toll/interleukin-1 receptor domain-containing protein [Kordiimonas aquimaris]|uniref:toll/interleukin-1 receptor domain-containing protein n=1 Tax=Kordiimonas aquimaris TaxID=707591 RepID=UPI0021D04D9C|nr:toll/interleukin-1 receptor domain-containing protein [Kordiimonas aquimaris]